HRALPSWPRRLSRSAGPICLGLNLPASCCMYALSLHDALPICEIQPTRAWEYLHIPGERLTPSEGSYWIMLTEELWVAGYFDFRSEEHTSELQSRENLVCRLLLEKKNDSTSKVCAHVLDVYAPT